MLGPTSAKHLHNICGVGNDEACRSPMMREMSDKELRVLPVIELIGEAEAQGITLTVADDRLRVRGPRRAEALGRLVLERKAEVLAALGSSRPRATPATGI